MEPTAKTTRSEQVDSLNPLLDQILEDARSEDQEIHQVLHLMGWEPLPDALILEIKEDIRAFCRELQGHYASCDPYVIRRRRRVDYWVRQYLEGACTLETAVQALHISPLGNVG